MNEIIRKVDPETGEILKINLAEQKQLRVDADYEPEAIKRKITERLVQELHDPSVKGMPLYKLCAELLDRIEGKALTRQAIVSDNKLVIEIVQFTPVLT